MKGRTGRVLVLVLALFGVAAIAAAICGGNANAQPPRQAGTLAIAGQPEQAALVRINGKSYVDLESLARITHGTLQFEGSRAILTLAGASAGTDATASQPKQSKLTESYLGAEIEALTQIREWHVSLVNAVNNSYPIADNWVGPIRRNAEAKLQLALAAATSELDQRASELLRNEFTNMQQMSDQLLQLHAQASVIPPDIFKNNTLDTKILACEQALAEMAATKQYQDQAQCH